MERLTPERVKAMLAKEGKDVTMEEAAIILDFLRKMADIVVDSYLNECDEDKKQNHVPGA